MNKIIEFSIVIPVFNQRKQLEITLNNFLNQDYPKDKYEIIVVDDGSKDLHKSFDEEWLCKFKNISVIHQKNKGRSAARNAGLSKAKGKYIVFCDGDRFPQRNYLKGFHDAIATNNNPLCIYIGCPMDYYGNIENIKDEQQVQKFSRVSKYYKKITNIYDSKGNTSSKLDWASFLVGNSCVHSSIFEKVDKFDEDFITWGFEHFELAYRMQLEGASFHICPEIKNFHIPHSSGTTYYLEAMQRSVLLMQKKHNNEKFVLLYEFIAGLISLQEFEQKFSGKICDEVRDKEPIFYRL